MYARRGSFFSRCFTLATSALSSSDVYFFVFFFVRFVGESFHGTMALAPSFACPEAPCLLPVSATSWKCSMTTFSTSCSSTIWDSPSCLGLSSRERKSFMCLSVASCWIPNVCRYPITARAPTLTTGAGIRSSGMLVTLSSLSAGRKPIAGGRCSKQLPLKSSTSSFSSLLTSARKIDILFDAACSSFSERTNPRSVGNSSSSLWLKSRIFSLTQSVRVCGR
mmetsp:Transcript_15685/g.37257  ORF Transcript_15685/g.37257 Transcript_15685/m.37257 type:complete len:222 (-) Transcript_15685:187-852(-)